MANQNAPFHPLIYVRGYAMTTKEIDETTADPFCGFNLGSTVYRAVPDKTRPPRKFIFESPVVRLASDFGYEDVYRNGYDIMDDEWAANPENKLKSRSIVVYRYYDEASTILGLGETPPIETFASRLADLVLRVRDLVCRNPENAVTPDDFRCYLVAHSMGGLVCRAFLQNPKLDTKNARQYVDKFFTYATPHNGIDVGGVNVPAWLTAHDTSNFNRDRMATYLAVEDAYAKTKRVDWMPEGRFPTDRIFCMVGSNRTDYEAAFGASRTFVGHGSDGLVRIENATLSGLKSSGQPGVPCAKAFAYRSHSGFFGLVNSEEAYQNLTRFLFGDVRADVWVDLDDVRPPADVATAAQAGQEVDALYQLEILAAPRGKLWYLTRRTVEEDSVACLSHADWMAAPKKNGRLYVSTVFLANRARVDKSRPSLAYSLTLGIRVPDYEIERKLWTSEHYEGGYLFRDSAVVEMVPPSAAGGSWTIAYAWQGQGSSPASTQVDTKALRGGKVEVRIPFDSGTTPGVTGALRFVVSAWNPDAQMAE
jgi:hypothetical protein